VTAAGLARMGPQEYAAVMELIADQRRARDERTAEREMEQKQRAADIRAEVEARHEAMAAWKAEPATRGDLS
jgi:hypothetical protein